MKPIIVEVSPTQQGPVGPMARVLLVDEDANDLRSFSSFLEQEGYDVRACARYGDALGWLECEIFDCVILSQGSPKFEGRSVLERAIEINRCLPVLVVARCADIGCYIEAVQLGALDYLEKPLPPPQLLRFVKDHLRARA
jgi:DNA-binding NtrC family response regulator